MTVSNKIELKLRLDRKAPRICLSRDEDDGMIKMIVSLCYFPILFLSTNMNSHHHDQISSSSSRFRFVLLHYSPFELYRD